MEVFELRASLVADKYLIFLGRYLWNLTNFFEDATNFLSRKREHYLIKSQSHKAQTSNLHLNVCNYPTTA